jgi:hypothetical protein
MEMALPHLKRGNSWLSASQRQFDHVTAARGQMERAAV